MLATCMCFIGTLSLLILTPKPYEVGPILCMKKLWPSEVATDSTSFLGLPEISINWVA